MGYLYEQLGDQRFQELCQAILVQEYRDLQCFPVGQPDGGRDGLSLRGDADSGPVTVLQVKYRKDGEQESAEWMIKALEGEREKIERLAAGGAERYLMITNAAGTAHPGGGRIDRVQKWLEDNLDIPAQCLWRDDIDRRLDNAGANLKLKYPSILTGDDTLVLMREAIESASKDRIMRAVRAFVAEQYRRDSEVKFRQVDLANSLLALFVDVPSDLNALVHGVQSRRRPSAALWKVLTRTDSEATYVDPRRERLAPTADLLLDSDFQAEAPRVVLRGAPGQGKSTLAQYVCQIHRARLLAKDDFLSAVEPHHASARYRLPIKVDLRDLAAFIDGQPYLGTKENSVPEPRGLERFIAELIRIESGGLAFDTSDLADIFSNVSTLLFLDGLDEVADLGVRERLVREVNSGLNRLEENGADLQVVVTSRPTLFTGQIGFGADFLRLDLAPIGPDTIRTYAKKWTEARNLERERADEVLQVLEAKLGQPHIRELTKNPMQLTILLSLIYAVGQSLPDQRTDLYRDYVEHFMNREAEKSAIVQKHRPLLAQIVEYTAWELQAAAESEAKAGSISEENLRSLVTSYLEQQGHKQHIIGEIFLQGIERVWVLVQRVEGLYEFEVQPLREFFAAKYLYDSAPHATRRNAAVSGDRSERFEAMAANPYWSNVTRFYAGFYASGEIGALSESLREMIASRDISTGIMARKVGAALLSDWIFKGKPFIQREMIELVYDRLGSDVLASFGLHDSNFVTLSEECGSATLAQLVFERDVLNEPAVLQRTVLLLRRNGAHQIRQQFVDWIDAAEPSERMRRIDVAARAGAFATGAEFLAAITRDEPSQGELERRALLAFRAGVDVVGGSEALVDLCVSALLNWGSEGDLGARGALGYFAALLDASRLRGVPFWHTDVVEPIPYDGTPSRMVNELAEALPLRPHDGRMRSRWELPPRADICEYLRQNFGENWAAYQLAIGSVGVFRTRDRVRKSIEADDTTLIERALIMRSWSGKGARWGRVLDATDGHERLFVLGVLLAWGRSASVHANLEQIGELVDALSDDDFHRLTTALEICQRARRYSGGSDRKPVALPAGASIRLFKAMYFAFGSGPLPDEALSDRRLRVVSVLQRASRSFERFPGWEEIRTARQADNWLGKLVEAEKEGAVFGVEHKGRPVIFGLDQPTAAVARSAFRNPRWMPSQVLMAVDSMYEAEHVPTPVGVISKRDGWTFA